jgi:2'-hydroxyisoflavone reductase
MKLLVLGGTRFLGRHTVDAALARGYEVTVFNRGHHNAGLPGEVETLAGDRDGELDALRGRRWDAVVDTCGYVPRVVGDSARLLADAAEHYTFVSSLSVYPSFAEPDLDESAPVGTLEDETVEKVDGETYGPLKALCERAVERAFPGRSASVRAGLIVGPRDDVKRFPWWVRRVAIGGDVLAPGTPDRHLQVVDARDLAEWMVRLGEERTAGVFNATGPDRTLTMGEFLDECRRVSGSDARFHWAGDAFLAEHGVTPWTDMPMYLPAEGVFLHFFDVDVSKAVAAGLRFRPLAESIRDVLEWTEPPLPRDFSMALPEPGISAEREAELLDKLSTNPHESPRITEQE